ncbi:ATP-binding protein [Pseudoponticoccus marisrubri]|uniref:histidine kinase n=1 Tax=Pseudoponticoccus marisrubri TaxID=1685382 RepID=A0A0W7WL57_9RHOB|nr:ATP-binding protein [Pseudoponticoccus marisrubri]KUF11263.1 hypothetical protein AVJ23_09460 [Pseudoponticoccus marisrubri]
MADAAVPRREDHVSRRRYERERRAREEAETLLEQKSRELYDANIALTMQASELEKSVERRTAELQRAKTEAERANAAKSDFLAMISHEIRTPLNGVLGMATALSETELAADQREMADTILSSGNALLGLLNDILDLAKIEAQQMEIDEVDFDLAALVGDVVRVYSVQARDRGLTFDARVAPEASGPVRGDPTRLRQVMFNLLSNALKFTERGGVTLEVTRQAGLWHLRVRDTGVGVPPDKQARLFKAFSQTDVSVTRNYGGTGLGLAIARRMCRLMGGDLVFAPAPGGGSDFTASVRLHAAAPGHKRPRPQRDEALGVLQARPWRVLVAEDSETNQKVLRLLLRGLGLRLELVSNGERAVERHCHDPFDIILMDVNMPVMDGMEAAGLIRQAECAHGLPRVPIVALTANAMTHQVADYLRQGIDAHVAKPVRKEDLVSVMAELLSDQAA